MIIMIHVKLSSLKYCSKLITGQIIALFGFIQKHVWHWNKLKIWRPDTEMALTWKNILALQTCKTSLEILTEISSQSVKLKNNYFKFLFMRAFV